MCNAAQSCVRVHVTGGLWYKARPSWQAQWRSHCVLIDSTFSSQSHCSTFNVQYLNFKLWSQLWTSTLSLLWKTRSVQSHRWFDIYNSHTIISLLCALSLQAYISPFPSSQGNHMMFLTATLSGIFLQPLNGSKGGDTHYTRILEKELADPRFRSSHTTKPTIHMPFMIPSLMNFQIPSL